LLAFREEFWGELVPLLVRKGGRDIKKMPRSLLVGADGGRSPRKPDRAQPSRKVVAHTVTWLVSDHPVCGAKVGFAEIYLMPQPPLLTRRGMSLRNTHRALYLLRVLVV
jgi:hypothetical protein